MALYLVRWPDLSASLVRAANEEELTYVLDEIGNPDDCEWSPYEGPVFVDFELPVEWSVRGSRSDRTTEPDQIVIGDIGLLATMSVTNALELDVAPAEDGALMAAEVVHTAFPELHRATEDQYERDPDGEGGQPLPEPDLREALRRELLRVLRASLDRARHEGDDAVSVLAREMDLPVSTARTYVDTARARQGNGKHGPEEPDHSGGPPPETLFQVPNYHGASSGRPPAIHADVPGVYLGYFANEHGEQAIFVYDRKTGEATVRMGDAGWDEAHPVEDGRVAGLSLTEAEAAWVRACWLAARGA